jgi:hypothetical protein
MTEGGVEQAAAAYGVDEQDILLAIKYYDHLQGQEDCAIVGNLR